MNQVKFALGVVGFVLWCLTFLVMPAHAKQVTVEFERELPYATVGFQRTFEDMDAFEMWLSDRLDRKGCDPYLKEMRIKFKN